MAKEISKSNINTTQTPAVRSILGKAQANNTKATNLQNTARVSLARERSEEWRIMALWVLNTKNTIHENIRDAANHRIAISVLIPLGAKKSLARSNAKSEEATEPAKSKQRTIVELR